MEQEQPKRTFKVKESLRLDDGAHAGEIVRIDYVDEPYQYVEFVVKVDDSVLELNYGCPQNLSANSKLGRMFELFGKTLTVNEEISEDEMKTIFVGQKVKFVTVTESVKRDGQLREYARIASESLKPSN